MTRHHQPQGKDSERRQELRRLARAFALPLEMVLGPVVGLYLGHLADEHWDTAPAFLLLGAVLGLGASLRAVYETVRDR